MKLVALVLIVHPLLILGFSALAVMTGAGNGRNYKRRFSWTVTGFI